MQSDKWNRLIWGMMFMHQRPRICLMLPLPRAQCIPAELPLADAIHMDVAQFLAIPHGELVGTTVTPDEAEEIEFIQMQETMLQEVGSSPASPTTCPSRIPTTSSGGSWEVLDSTGSSPVARSYPTLRTFDSLGYQDLGLIVAKASQPQGVCYRFYIGDDEQKQELQKLQLHQQMPPSLQRVERRPQDRQLPSSSSTQLPPPAAKAALMPNQDPVKAALMPKAPPKPPFNLQPHCSPPKPRNPVFC